MNDANYNNEKIIPVDRKNNFDFIRLILASCVIISHSFPLTGKKEPLLHYSHEQIDLGRFAVECFFAMSGYLIFQSLERSKTILSYLWKRILRLFPALLVLLLLTMLILPFVYKGKDIFEENSYWSYFPNVLSLYRVQYYVNGVFTNNPYPRVINGSLWSLSYEFSLYLFLLLLFPIKKHLKYIRIMLILAFAVAYLLLQFKPSFLNSQFDRILLTSELSYKLASFFLAGSILSFLNFKKFNTLLVRLSLSLILIISIFFNLYGATAPLVLPILIIMLSKLNTPPINLTGKAIGDISYGVYIYVFFVQQLLMYFFNLSTPLLMVTGLFVTYCLAFLSWHYIESTSLKFKNLF